MVETIGKKLCQARLARGISLEEAAHATRVRPEKLIALENDDYGRFGGNAYAKGFLQIYGRYLGVDVSQDVQALEIPRQVTISDYQYLNNAPEPEPNRIQFQRQNQRPSVVPLVMLLGLILAGVAALAGYMFNVTMERLEPKQPTASRQTAAPAPQAAPVGIPAPTGNNATTASTSIVRTTDADFVSGNNPLPVANTEGVQPGIDVSPAQPSGATGQPGTNGVPAAEGTSPVAPTTASNELVVKPLKKTWVKIRRDSATAVPIFEDFLYPNSRPLTLRGSKFYVEVREQDAVEIQKNGHPIAYQAPGISIQ